MKLTKKRAKSISLEVWEYLRDHPEIKSKDDLPTKIFTKIRFFRGKCSLCEVLNFACRECCLNCLKSNSYYGKWKLSKSNKTRAKYAGIIVEKIKAWNV